MVIRRVSVRLYLAAAAFVLGVIFVGLLLAVLINVRRANKLESQWSRAQVHWDRVQSRYLELLHQFSTENCVATRLALIDSVENMNALQQKLDKYMASPFGGSNRRFIELKREHAILALAHWSISMKLRKTCITSVLPVLYLYSRKNCSQCFFQTRILLFMERRNRPKLVVFPVDLDFTPPAQVAKLKEHYAVTTLPASIIAETKYESLLSKGMLQIILTAGFQRSADGLAH